MRISDWSSDVCSSDLRPPRAALRPFVDLLWSSDGSAPTAAARRELVLPTGALHLVVSLSASPLRVFRDLDDPLGFTVPTAVLGGARAAPYVTDIARPLPTVAALKSLVSGQGGAV